MNPASHDPEPITVTFLVIDALDALGAPYLIGGSLASARYGIPRATMDADLVAELRHEHAEPLAQALTPAFYVDTESIHKAIRDQRSFNLIHLETMFKVDIFIRKPRAFDQSQFARRVRATLSTSPERSAYIASPEDTVLAKLEWYKIGGQMSDRQWRDILGVLKAQAENLDLAYLRLWAKRLQVPDLLARALLEAGLAN
ncbi:MAG: hypothetical protein B6D41_01485 [Chloroflexi bacterium UTCFX4]|jgi:hypothetical protein|nr:MAG: hypothetical protein B6D41_01485 [Chloroflexi bacterium UTCFX4]